MPQSKKPTSQRRTPAHRAEFPVRKRFAVVGGILTSTAIIGGCAFLGLTGVGGTYALWDGSSSLSAPPIHAGTMALAVGVAGSESASYTIPSGAWSNLLPGDSVRQQVSVKVNNTPSTLSSNLKIKSSVAVPAAFELRVQKGACTGVLTGTPLSTTDVSIGTWTATETSIVCVQVSLRSDAANAVQGTSMGTIGFTVTAKQQ